VPFRLRGSFKSKKALAGFIPKSSKQDSIVYYRQQAELKRTTGLMINALAYLLDYNKSGKLPFKVINEKYLKGFIAFLKAQELRPLKYKDVSVADSYYHKSCCQG
jgi:hypothetical protein